MKTKKLIAILICLATVLTVTAACSKKDGDGESQTAYVTDENGQTMVADVSVEYVTNENGDNVVNPDTKEQETILHYFVTEVDEKGNVVTNKNKEPVTKKHSSSADENTSVDLGDFEDYLNNGGELPTVEVETMPEGTTINQNNKLIQKAFSSGKFYMEMSLENELNMPVSMTFATSGNNLYFGFNFNLGIMKMGYAAIQKDGKSYAIDTISKTYCESGASSADTSDIDEMMSTLVVDSNANFLQTSIVTSKGKTYICEEYKTDYGTSKYYFDKSTEELKRIEHDNSGTSNVITVKKFVKDPSASYFSVPSGYKKVSAEKFNSSFEDVFGSLGL